MSIFIHLQLLCIASNFEKLAPSCFIIITTTANTTSSVVGEALSWACFLFQCSHCVYSLESSVRDSLRRLKVGLTPPGGSPRRSSGPPAPSGAGLLPRGLTGNAPPGLRQESRGSRAGGEMGVSAHALPELGLAPGRGGDWSAVGARRVLRNSCARGGGGVRVRTRASGPSQQELPPRADRGATIVRIPAPGGSQAAVV